MPTYDIRGISVRFPFEAYDCQLVYMERVIQSLQEKKNALLESPTGTGKTLCLVCSTLAWRDHYIKEEIERLSLQFEEGEIEFTQEELSFANATPAQIIYRKVIKEAPKIIYASRTHSQLSQVMDELKNCPYNPKASVLGSRKQLCINQAVLNKPSNAQGNACRKLISQHKCRFSMKVGEFKNHHDFVDEPLAIEELAKLGKSHGVCPYFMSKEMQTEADIILLPYNYLIDPTSRKSLNVDLKDSILIFDEAHNLESVCSDAASFQITSASVQKCLDQLEDINQLAATSSSFLESYELTKDSLQQLKDLFTKFLASVMALELATSQRQKGVVKPGEYIIELFEKAGVTSENYITLREVLEILSGIISDELGTYASSAFHIERFSTAISVVFGDTPGELISKYYKVFVSEFTPDQKGYGRSAETIRTVNFWCFNSGVAMRNLNASGIRSFILTSGTLSPLDSFAYELQTDFPIQLENPHVIEPSQIWIGVAKMGPSSKPLNTSYTHRNNVTYIQELGNTIVNFCRIVPSGVLVFFSSYTVMEQYIAAWKKKTGTTPPVWDRITLYKKPVSEPRDGNILNDTIEDFYKKVKDPEENGAVFFAVCRGKVSEGLDFANDNGRAVIVTGIPFPNMVDQRVKLKQQYLDAESKKIKNIKTLTGNEWYKQQASRAVNQAVGRVIRHRTDYGAIILCDERFSYTSNKNQISAWLRPHIRVYERFGEVNVGLTRFFKYAKANFIVPKKKEETTNAITSVGSDGVTFSRPVSKRKKFSAPRKIESKKETQTTLFSAGKKRKLPSEETEDSLKNSFNLLNSSLRPAPTAAAKERKKKKAKSAVEYIQTAKRMLSKEEYKEFQSLLRKYKQKLVPIEDLVVQVEILFADGEKKSLLHGFAAFIPEKHKDTFAELLIKKANMPADSGDLITTEEKAAVPLNPPPICPTPIPIDLDGDDDVDMKNIDVPSVPITHNVDIIIPTPIVPSSTTNVLGMVTEENRDAIVAGNKEENSIGANDNKEKDTSAVVGGKKEKYDLVTGRKVTSKQRPKCRSEPLLSDCKVIEVSEENEEEGAEMMTEPTTAILSQEDAGGIKCSVCLSNATSPFAAPCGHICCKHCWDQWLEQQLICPVCRDKVRPKKLRKLFFT